MNPCSRIVLIPMGIAVVTLTGACDRGEPRGSAPEKQAPSAEPTPTNRVAIPSSVRSNLGITFVKVERRRIEQTLRVPGRFEYRPTARREYRAALPGRVELLVEQFEHVEPGTVLCRIDSPAWREHQEKLVEAEASIERLRTRVASYAPLREAHRVHERQLEETIAIRKERAEQLERLSQAGGGRQQELMQVRDAVSTAEAELAEILEKEAAIEADEAEARAGLKAAEARFEFLLGAASAILGDTVEALTASGPAGARWRTIRHIEVRAEEDGVVETIGVTNGAWATSESTLTTLVRPDRLRFRASGLQSDLGVLRDGLAARIVPPTQTLSGNAVPMLDTMSGTLTLGLAGDPHERTLDLFVVPDELRMWVRPGVSAQLEIVTDEPGGPALAIPRAAIVKDGITHVFFWRDPQDPNKAIRVEADMGIDDGRWVVINSGLSLNDEIVLDGAYELKLASEQSGVSQKGGHFHADGTFHGDH